MEKNRLFSGHLLPDDFFVKELRLPLLEDGKNFEFKYYKRSKGDSMKANVLTLMCVLSLLSSRGFCNDFPEFTLAEMDPVTMEGFQKGELQGILRIEQGEKLPFSLSVEGTVIALPEAPEPFLIEALQRVYIKIDKNDFSFSLDKTTWKSFEEQFGGELGVSAGNSEEGPFGNFYLKLNLK